MKFKIKNLAIILCGVASCNAMQFNNNNFNYNNQFYNSMNNANNFGHYNNNKINTIHKDVDSFYNNSENIKQYLRNKIKSINNNGMQLNCENCDKFDLDLFTYNINKYPSAKTNIEVLLNSLAPNDMNTINQIKNIITSNNEQYILNILLDNNNISLILKKLIIGINVGTLLFNIENEKKSNDISKINPILLLDGNDQCWFNSTLQLINSAVECAPQEVLSKLTNKPGYVLVEFLKYLRQESITCFENNEKHVLNKSSKKNIDGLNLYNEFENFETTLSKKQLSDWNSIPRVEEGKKILQGINKNGILGNGPTAMAILAKIFPEIKELFYVSWQNVLSQEFDLDYFGNFDNTIPNDNSQYFLVDTFYVDKYFSYKRFMKYNKDTSHDNKDKLILLVEQIANNKWRIGFDQNNNFVIYTVRGLQLFVNADTNNEADNNFVTHAALDNYSNTWHFSDTVGYNSNPQEELDISAPTEVQKRDFGKREDDYNRMNINAFMYRKMTSSEVTQYIK